VNCFHNTKQVLDMEATFGPSMPFWWFEPCRGQPSELHKWSSGWPRTGCLWIRAQTVHKKRPGHVLSLCRGDPALISPAHVGPSPVLPSEKGPSVYPFKPPAGSSQEPQPPRSPIDDVVKVLWCIFWILVAVSSIIHGGDLPLPGR
jgi:hypothetical protein